jgi:hypothetical protein
MEKDKKRDESPPRKLLGYRTAIVDYTEADILKCEQDLSALNGLAADNQYMVQHMHLHCFSLGGIRSTDMFSSKPIELDWKPVDWRTRPQIADLVTSPDELELLPKLSPKFCLQRVAAPLDNEHSLRRLLNAIYQQYLDFWQNHRGTYFYPQTVDATYPFPWEAGSQKFSVPISLFHASDHKKINGQPLEPLVETVQNALDFATRLVAKQTTAYSVPRIVFYRLKGIAPPGKWQLARFIEMDSSDKLWMKASYTDNNTEPHLSLDGYFKLPLSLDADCRDMQATEKGVHVYPL